MEHEGKYCINCKWGQNWCCPKKKAKGWIMCLNPKHKGPPMELDGMSYCNNYEVKED